MNVDVVVIGGGIAGGFLARQLEMARPGLAVLVLEARETIDDFKVGESTVEIAASYMIRRLGLSAYLYQHQLPKNGLRFFFDDADKALPITAMAEIGSDHLPFHPSFQLERASLERDLVAMNRAIGVDVQLGAKVVDVTIDPAGPHKVVWERGGEKHEVATRWVCDASGRRQVLARKLSHQVTKEARLETAAAWGRYRNVAGLDVAGDPAWRARARNTSRHLSTNHFMYDGYWIWFIPLAGDLMSVGVVYDRARCPDGPKTRDEMEAFVRKHRAPRELFEGAVFEDFQAYAHLPFHSDDYFSTDRWAKTGEAGAFTDPFYSPGSDFIATANEFTTAMVLADKDGYAARVAELVSLGTDFYKLKYESSLGLYVKQYPTFGSFEVFRLKYRLDFHNYYNLVYWPFLADKLTDSAWLRRELRFADLQLRAVRAFGEHLARLADELRARGEYHRDNRGRFLDGLDGVAQLQDKLGPVLDEEYRARELDRTYADVYVHIVERLLRVPGLAERARVHAELTLAIILALKDIDESSLARLLQRVAGRLTRDVQKRVPEAGVEKVTLEVEAPGAAASRSVRVQVVAASDDGTKRALEVALSLWDEPVMARPGAMPLIPSPGA